MYIHTRAIPTRKSVFAYLDLVLLQRYVMLKCFLQISKTISITSSRKSSKKAKYEHT